MPKLPVLYFDFDGTLHDSLTIYEPAFRAAHMWLIENGHAENRPVDRSRIAGWLGLTKYEMWTDFMPDLPEAIRDQAGHLIGETMVALTEQGHARLFPGTEETLSDLKSKGYKLVMVSNCSNAYMIAMRAHFQLDQWFSGYYTAEAYNYQPKDYFLKTAIEDHGRPAIMIGDREKDITAGKENNAITLGCTFGYGTDKEVYESDFTVSDIRQLSMKLYKISCSLPFSSIIKSISF